jgi:hypothetical protein
MQSIKGLLLLAAVLSLAAMKAAYSVIFYFLPDKSQVFSGAKFDHIGSLFCLRFTALRPWPHLSRATQPSERRFRSLSTRSHKPPLARRRSVKLVRASKSANCLHFRLG